MTTRFASGRETLVGRGIPQVVPITLDAAAYAGALVYGIDGNFYRSNGTTWLLEAPQVFNTSAPNATVPVMAVRPDPAQNAATNVDAAIVPRGTGALLADIPDNTAAGGNKRGANAVDWQTVRGAASQVASGAAAFIGGGQNNTASGLNATIGGGLNNTASNGRSTVGGGENNAASGYQSTVGGGQNNTASGSFNTIPGGYSADTRNLYGRLSYASGRFTTNGDAQYGLHVLRRATTDATQAGLGADANAPIYSPGTSTTNIPILPNNSLYSFRIRVSCIQEGGTAGVAGDCKAWDIVGAIKRGANAAATALLGTPTITVLGADTNLGATNDTGAIISVIANTTLGGLVINVTGQVNKNLRWVATVETTEVAY